LRGRHVFSGTLTSEAYSVAAKYKGVMAWHS